MNSVFLRRPDLGVIRLEGADRRSYLHGLLTNDILAMSQPVCYAALLTAQGRMITDMYLSDDGTAITAVVPRELAAGVAAHFDRFVITEDVSVSDLSTGRDVLAVYGPDVTVFTSPDNDAVQAVGTDDLGAVGFFGVLPPAYVDPLTSTLAAAGARQISLEDAEILRVEAGIPKFLADMDTATIPLEAGIEDRAISLTKGCYVGQEVIIRVLHRGGGRVAKKLVGLQLSVPATRDDVLSVEGRDIGRITSAVVSPRFGPIALGYVQRDFVTPGTEVSVRSNGTEAVAIVASVPLEKL